MTIVTPLIVKSEATHPIIPRYINRIQVLINGAKASPNVCTRSADGFILRLWVKNPYADTKVKISRATPTASTVIPERPILSLKFLNMLLPLL